MKDEHWQRWSDSKAREARLRNEAVEESMRFWTKIVAITCLVIIAAILCIEADRPQLHRVILDQETR